MTDVRRAYSSTVIAPGHLVASAVVAAALLAYGTASLPAAAIAGPAVGAIAILLLQTFGIGVPFRWKTTRLTIRPGPTLELVLSDGEHIRVSTADPVAAALLITGERRTATHPGTDTGKGEHQSSSSC